MNLWAAIKLLCGYSNDDVENTLDHVPVSGDKDYRKLLAKARERHGRQFHTHERKPRETPPSRDLIEIEKAVSLRATQQKLHETETQQKVRKITK